MKRDSNQQSAEWIEVGDDAAREKTSQVLRDAVTGLLDKKMAPRTSTSLSATVSAQTSNDTDEHDAVAAAVASTSGSSIVFSSIDTEEVPSNVARLPSEETSYGDGPRSYDLSPRKRRRQHDSVPVSAPHSFDDHSLGSSAAPSSFEYSPIRRHHSASPRHRPRYEAASLASGGDFATRRGPTIGHGHSTEHRHSQTAGSDYLGQLMQGELLESDTDDDLPLIP